MEINQYGKSIENPILLNSIDSSLLFLNALITNTGNYIIYHRLGSSIKKGSKPIDKYEIITTDNNRDVIFISIYNSRSNFVPPYGYFFDSLSDLFFNSMFNEKEFVVKKKYWYSGDMPGDEKVSQFPLIKYINSSFGCNLRHKNFPFDLILNKLKEECFLTDDIIQGLCQKYMY